MNKYFDSPLKVTGLLLTFAGLIPYFSTTHPSLPPGYTISSMGILVFMTAFLLMQTHMNRKFRKFFELSLITVIVLSTFLLALDYHGVITLRHFQR
jgi:amino acid permease